MPKYYTQMFNIGTITGLLVRNEVEVHLTMIKHILDYSLCLPYI